MTILLNNIDKIIGMDEAKNDLLETLEFLDSEGWKNGVKSGMNFSKGMLLVGHPGCGKTELMKIVTKEFAETNTLFKIEVTSKGTLGSHNVGEPTKNVNKLFNKIRKDQDHIYIILMDEIDEIIVSKDNRSILSTELTTAVNVNIDGFDSPNNFYIIGTTNHPWRLDVSSTRGGRIGDVIYVKDPNRENRRRLFEFYVLARLEICDWDDIKTHKVALNSYGLNGSDFEDMGGYLYKKQSVNRKKDPYYKLTSQHIHETISKRLEKRERQNSAYKVYQIEDCNPDN